VGLNDLHACQDLHCFRCHFPFTYGKIKYTSCSTSYTPTYDDPLCTQLKKSAGESFASAPIKVVDESGKTLTTCFDHKPRDFGW